MELEKIKLTKLFGIFDHEITIKDGGITLVLGENGLGKTVILKMLKIIFDGDYVELKNYDFERLDIVFKDFKFSFFGSISSEDDRLIVRKYKGNTKQEELDFLKPKEFENYSQPRLFEDESNFFDNDFIIHRKVNPEIEYIIDKYLGRHVSRMGRNEWLEHRTGRTLSTGIIMNKYGASLPKRFRMMVNYTPAWLEEFSSRLKIYLIETQRLKTNKSSENYQDAVIELSKELSQTVKGLLASANEYAAQLDRSYPNRLLTQISALETITDEELKTKLTSLENRRKRLTEVGLVDSFDDEIQIESDKKNVAKQQQELINNVLLVYIEDSNNKLGTYDDLANKLEVFISILNKRLNVKYVQIDKEKGLKIIPEKDRLVKNKREIPLNGLSSGEQHMIILFYNLLFKCKDNPLILIDEPEISLHITWQNEFINDLIHIKNVNPFEAIIATHSPDIINDNWDLTVELLEK